MDWFLFDNGLRHERVKPILHNIVIKSSIDCTQRPLAFHVASMVNVNVVINKNARKLNMNCKFCLLELVFC